MLARDSFHYTTCGVSVAVYSGGQTGRDLSQTRGQSFVPGPDELVGIRCPSGVRNPVYGVWRSHCCSMEIVLYPDFVFPKCNKHSDLPTEWIFVSTDILAETSRNKSAEDFNKPNILSFLRKKEVGGKMAVQGRAFSEQEIERIVRLLSTTEMTIGEIAARMQCSRSAVISINRRCKVRAYNGHKTNWQNATDIDESTPAA